LQCGGKLLWGSRDRLRLLSKLRIGFENTLKNEKIKIK
jgi:hypothetical protein